MSVRAFVLSAEALAPRSARVRRLLTPAAQGVRACAVGQWRCAAVVLGAQRCMATRIMVDPFVAEHVRTKPNEPLPAVEVLKLTAEEKELLDLLDQAVLDRKLRTTVRIAGGWVRDKLLNLGEKKDVDIAVDDMTGVKFARLFNNWSTKRHGVTFPSAVIATNPEKSKHLETANMQVGSFSVDFVNLRTDQYDDSSRVPTVKAAAAEEDAKRRDLTINSLFYNLRTKQIEDFTGKGLEDLCDGIIRTPLEPGATLLDDPLRMLRSVRFACRFGYVFDDALYKACFRDDIRTALEEKISAERMAIELQYMLGSNSSARAISTLHHFGVLSTVLGMPGTEHIKPFASVATQKYALSSRQKPRFFQHDSSSLCEKAVDTYLTFAEWRSQVHDTLGFGPEQADLQAVKDALCADSTIAADHVSLGLSILTFPAAAFEYDFLGKKRHITLPEYIILTGMRRSSNIASTASIIHGTAIRTITYLLEQDLDAVIASLNVNEATVKAQLEGSSSIDGVTLADVANLSATVGAVRRVDLAMLAYKRAVRVNASHSQPAIQNDDADILRGSVEIVDAAKYQRLVKATLAVYRAFKLLELEDVHTLKPLLDGGKVQKILPKLRVGPALGEVMESQLRLQAARKSTTQAEMEQFLKNAHPEYC